MSGYGASFLARFSSARRPSTAARSGHDHLVGAADATSSPSARFTAGDGAGFPAPRPRSRSRPAPPRRSTRRCGTRSSRAPRRTGSLGDARARSRRPRSRETAHVEDIWSPGGVRRPARTPRPLSGQVRASREHLQEAAGPHGGALMSFIEKSCTSPSSVDAMTLVSWPRRPHHRAHAAGRARVRARGHAGLDLRSSRTSPCPGVAPYPVVARRPRRPRARRSSRGGGRRPRARSARAWLEVRASTCAAERRRGGGRLRGRGADGRCPTQIMRRLLLCVRPRASRRTLEAHAQLLGVSPRL